MCLLVVPRRTAIAGDRLECVWEWPVARLPGRPEVRGVQLALKEGLAAGERSGRAWRGVGAGGQRGEGALAKQKWGMGDKIFRGFSAKRGEKGTLPFSFWRRRTTVKSHSPPPPALTSTQTHAAWPLLCAYKLDWNSPRSPQRSPSTRLQLLHFHLKRWWKNTVFFPAFLHYSEGQLQEVRSLTRISMVWSTLPYCISLQVICIFYWF